MIAYAALQLYVVWPEHEIDPADRQTIRTSIELLALLTDLNLKTCTVKISGRSLALRRVEPSRKLDALLMEPVE